MLEDGLLLNQGKLFVAVDGKPLEKTLADPAANIKFASYGYYLFALLAIFSIFIFKSLSPIFIGVAVIMCFFGVLTTKIPLLFISIGIIWGVIELIGYIRLLSLIMITHGSLNYLMILFWGLLRVGVILNFIKGIIAAFKLNSFKKGKLIKMTLKESIGKVDVC